MHTLEAVLLAVLPASVQVALHTKARHFPDMVEAAPRAGREENILDRHLFLVSIFVPSEVNPDTLHYSNEDLVYPVTCRLVMVDKVDHRGRLLASDVVVVDQG